MWIDLGDGRAISPSRIREIKLTPPAKRPNPYPYKEQVSWCVHILDDNVWRLVEYFDNEDEARNLAECLKMAVEAEEERK